jgi:hypothetical protein
MVPSKIHGMITARLFRPSGRQDLNLRPLDPPWQVHKGLLPARTENPLHNTGPLKSVYSNTSTYKQTQLSQFSPTPTLPQAPRSTRGGPRSATTRTPKSASSTGNVDSPPETGRRNLVHLTFDQLRPSRSPSPSKPKQALVSTTLVQLASPQQLLAGALVPVCQLVAGRKGFRMIRPEKSNPVYK